MAVALLNGSVITVPERITDPTTSIPVLLANNFAEAQGLETSSMYYLSSYTIHSEFSIMNINEHHLYF